MRSRGRLLSFHFLTVCSDSKILPLASPFARTIADIVVVIKIIICQGINPSSLQRITISKVRNHVRCSVFMRAIGISRDDDFSKLAGLVLGMAFLHASDDDNVMSFCKKA